MSDGAKSGKRWFPLESNPDVMNKYLQEMGFPTDKYACTDVLSTEEWALAMVPKPVVAVVFLYPIKEATEKHRAEEAARIASEGQEVSPNVFYMKQFVGNACGTIGLLHAACNATDMAEPAEGSFVAKFVADCKGKDAAAIGRYLEESEEVETAHGSAAEAGQSAVPSLEESVETHFVAFSHVDGALYELDGRKSSPINHGPTTQASLLEDACKVIRGFMERDAGEMRFTIVAIAAAESGE